MTREEQDEKEFEEEWNIKNPELLNDGWTALKQICLKWWLASRSRLLRG